MTNICVSEQMWSLERSFALSSEEDGSDVELLHIPTRFARYEKATRLSVLWLEALEA
jgi:hypothetical protein